MLTLRRSERLRSRVLTVCRNYLATQSQTAVVATNDNDEYTEKPEYPEIRDLSFRRRKVQEAKDWHEVIRNVPTVEEKMIKINMPRYYGYKVVDLSDKSVPYNALPATQHYTRTIFEEVKPEGKVENKQLDSMVEAAKSSAVDALEYVHDYFRNEFPATNNMDPVEREQQLTQLIVEQLNRTLMQTLSADYQHLQDLEVDYNPRHEAFWAVGGIDPPKNTVRSKKGRKWQEEYANDSIDRLMQFNSTPYLALRHRQQLPVWAQGDQVSNLELAKQVPRFNYDPRTLGYSTKHQHGTNIPGYWPNNAITFGYLSFQSRANLQLRPASYGEKDQQEALHALAIQSSYAWLLAQSNYNGFNTYNELTYPMNTQTIVTNGRDWSFYEYQLNTLLVHGDNVNTNPRVNNCRGTTEQRLYEEIGIDGKCVGFNDQVLRQLVRCYMNVPNVQRSVEELQPYLDSSHKRAADYENIEQREFLEKEFKHMCANRSRHLEIPEIYMWEKIYKIDHSTRQMEAKRRFFERGINPWQRTMDQRDKEYIPRACRPEGPKSRKKFKQTYYP